MITRQRYKILINLFKPVCAVIEIFRAPRRTRSWRLSRTGRRFGTTERPRACRHSRGAGRAVRYNAARQMPVFCAGARHARPRPPVRGASSGRLLRAEKTTAFPSPHNRSHPWRGDLNVLFPGCKIYKSFDRKLTDRGKAVLLNAILKICRAVIFFHLV